MKRKALKNLKLFVALGAALCLLSACGGTSNAADNADSAAIEGGEQMTDIKITVEDKKATPIGAPVIVCGNSDYIMTFTFDDEWSQTGVKTARFVYVKDGVVQHEDVPFSGSNVTVPILSNVDYVNVGVFAEELRTTTPARINCQRSIRCGSGTVQEPTPDVYDQIMALFNEMAEKGAFGATEQQARQIEQNKQNIDLLTAEKADQADVDALEAQVSQHTQSLSQLSTEKAEQTDVDVLKARMDTFTSLPEGATIETAALEDIRVGADGTLYDTPAEAVRGQVGDLKSDLSELEASVCDVAYSKQLFDRNLVEDGMLNIYGTVNNPDDGYLHSQKIEVESGKTIYFSNLGIAVNARAITTYISGTVNYANGKESVNSFTVPEGVTEIVISYNEGYQYFQAEYDEITEFAEYGKVVTLKESEAVTSSKNMLGISEKIEVTPVEKIGYVTNTGVTADGNTSYRYSEPIHFVAGDLVTYKCGGNSGGNVAVLSKVIGNDIYNDVLNVPTTETATEYTYFVTEDCELVFSWINKNGIEISKVSSSGYKEILHAVNAENPLENIDKIPYRTELFDKITCIGDSLTQGIFNVSNDGVNQVALPQYSVPAYLAKITGSETVNLGIGSTCASRQNDNDSWFYKAETSAYDFLKAENIGDAVIIALGVNDITTFDSFTGDVETDIDLTNRENNALTSVGGYANIIQWVREQPNKENVPIFLVTITNVQHDWSDGIPKRTEANNKIRAIADKFENCYVIDLERYAEVNYDEQIRFKTYCKNGSHNNALGYNLRARQIATLIDKIVEENISKFYDVQFMGTEYYFTK